MNKSLRDRLCLFIISLSVLCYELLIIRVISVIFTYELLFIIISLSICGLGMGGVLYYIVSIKNKNSESFVRVSVLLFPMSFIASIFLIINYFFYIKIAGSILAVILPFFIGGIIISYIFSKDIAKSGVLYFFDLIGGSIGCVLSIPMIHYLGGINSILMTSCIASIALLLFEQRGIKWVIAIIPIAILSLNMRYSFIDLNYNKILKTGTPLGLTLKYPGLKAEWIRSEWDIYSRCDLVRASKDDMKRSIFINGGTQATMMRFDDKESTRTAIERYKNNSILYFPYLFGSNDKVLNIGSGGGRDVLFANLAGAKDIVAVEVNKGVTDMTIEEKDYNGNIYGLPNVRLMIEDGRTFIMKTEERFDKIVLSLASTFAFSDINSMAQMENYLYTKEAFAEYLNHLTKDGTVIIFIDFPKLLEKFIMTALYVLNEEYGISYEDGMKRISAFATKDSSGYGYLIMIKKDPYTIEEAEMLFNKGEGYNLEPVTIPHAKSHNDFDLIALGKLSPAEYINNNTANLTPSTDNTPFFLEVVFNHRVSLVILLLSIVILLLFVIIYFQTGVIKDYLQRDGSKNNLPHINMSAIQLFIPYFIFIGVGFMLVEILLTKRFSFYLEHPHLNIAVILFTILLGTGCGSIISSVISLQNLLKYTAVASVLLFIALIGMELTHTIFIKSTISSPLIVKSFLTVLYLSPFSILLGFFFPAGMRVVGEISPEMSPWFWGINGISSVIGSVASVVIAMISGFNMVLYLAAALYLGIIVIIKILSIAAKEIKI